MYIKNGDIDVPIIEGATYVYDSQTSKAKQNRGRKFQLEQFNKNYTNITTRCKISYSF